MSSAQCSVSSETKRQAEKLPKSRMPLDGQNRIDEGKQTIYEHAQDIHFNRHKARNTSKLCDCFVSKDSKYSKQIYFGPTFIVFLLKFE